MIQPQKTMAAGSCHRRGAPRGLAVRPVDPRAAATKALRGFLAGARLWPVLLALTAGCAGNLGVREVQKPLRGTSQVESWQCRNDMEIRCGEGRCEAETGSGFTPMSVSVNGSGEMSVCAYSGCWEGTGKVLRSAEFLVLIGVDLKFSTARDSRSGADIVVAIDRADAVATLKVGEFAQPLLCERQG